MLLQLRSHFTGASLDSIIEDVAKAFKVIGKIAGVFFVIFIVITAFAISLLPYFDLKILRERIAIEASSKLKSKVTISHAFLAIYPRPNVTLRGVMVESSQWGKLTSGEMKIYPHLTPLLKKKIELKKLVLKRPILHLTLADVSIDKGKKGVLYLKQIGVPVIPALKIAGGEVNVLRRGKEEPFFTIQGVQGEIYPQNSEEVKLGLQFTCSGATRVELRGRGDPILGKGNFELIAEGISLDKLVPFMGWEGIRVISSYMNLVVYGEVQSWERMQLKLGGEEFRITLADQGGEEEIRAGAWKGLIERELDVWSLNIEPVEFFAPSMKVSAHVDVKGGEFCAFRIEGTGVKVAEVRKSALTVFEKYKTVQEIFQILQEGEIAQVIFSGEGKDFREAFDLEHNMDIRGTLFGGKVVVPKGILPLEAVSGKVEISQAIMRGWDIDARLGRSMARNGTLLIGLTEERDIFHLEAKVEADGSDIVYYLPLILKEEVLRSEIKKFREVKGRVMGRLVLGENTNDIRPMLEVDTFQVAFRHDFFPVPVSLEDGKFSLRERVLVWKGVKGRLGGGTISQGAGRVSLTAKRPSFEISSLEGNLMLGEVGTLLKEHLGLAWLKSIKGALKFKDLKLKATFNPFLIETISFRARPGDLVIHQSFTPFPLFLKGGNLSLDKKMLTWSGVNGKLGKSTLRHAVVKVSLLVKKPSLEISLLEGAIVLDELGGWLKGLLGLGGLKSIKGDLKFKRLKLKGALNPFQIKNISFRAWAGDIFIHPSFVNTPFSLKGCKLNAREGLVIKVLRDGNRRPYGKLLWETDSIVWGTYRGRSAEGSVIFDYQRTKIMVNRADLCGINFQGSVSVDKRLTILAFQFGAKEAELSQTVSCLRGKESPVEGAFNLDGDLKAKGGKDPLEESSQGTLLFHSTKGKIYRWTLFSRLFSLLNVMEFFKGKLPDLKQKGFTYDTFTIKGEVKNGSLHLKEAVIDGPAMKIVGEGEVHLLKGEADLVILLAPLKTVDIVMDHIPILGKILTGESGTFISVPFSVKGPLDDPKITPLPPSTVGSALWGLIKRTLEAPIEVIKPALPKQ